MREITGLNTKQVVNNLNKLRISTVFSVMLGLRDIYEKAGYYLEEAIKTSKTIGKLQESFDDVIRYISKDEEHHKVVGQTAAKYVETLQRSNEQLVKVSSLIYKQQAGDTGLSDTDRAEIFDMLQGGSEDVAD